MDPSAKRHAPATARNREPIADVLARHLPATGTVLEVAAGTGEHAVHFGARFRGVTWQPTDVGADALASIAAWTAEAGLENVRAPIALDVLEAPWPIDRADVIVCINMIHIAPWRCAEALLAGAARLLPPGAPLVLYGPYNVDGAFTSPSNASFDASLRGRDPSWGIRDLADVERAAANVGLSRVETAAMPANNLTVIFRRDAAASDQ